MQEQKAHCAKCWCKLPPGTVAWIDLYGRLICLACAETPDLAANERVGAYDDGR